MEVTRDLPTPPFPLTTPMTFLMLLMACGFLRKSAADASLLLQFCVQVLQSWVQPSGTGSCAAPAQLAEQVEQSWVHSLMMIFPP